MRAHDGLGHFVKRTDGPHFEGHAIYFDRKGYACIWLNARDTRLHVLIWERANGPKPLGHEIHHRDEDKANFTLSNLELLTNADHQRLHAGWIKDCRGQWAAKPCTSCLRVFALAEFYPRKGFAPSPKCKYCHCNGTKAWAAKNPEKRKEISRNWARRKRASEAASH